MRLKTLSGTRIARLISTGAGHRVCYAPGHMPRPLTERQAWARERQEELPQRLAALQAEQEATALERKAHHALLAWRIRQVRLRMAELDRRLAGPA